ncbi:MAG: hypothetical protein WC455_17740 [Dehalococcoidia bacterium]|jgi:formylmethanofuran dehydrogenase subunit E
MRTHQHDVDDEIERIRIGRREFICDLCGEPSRVEFARFVDKGWVCDDCAEIVDEVMDGATEN